MRAWTGVALALTEAGGDEMGSRLSTYLHPLAGRPLVWHTVCSLATLRPAASRLILLARPELPGEILRDIPAPLQVVEAEGTEIWGALVKAGAQLEGDVLLLDAAAPAAGSQLQRLLDDRPERTLAAQGGGLAAALLSPEMAQELLSTPIELRHADPAAVAPPPDGEAPALVVRSRAGFARAVRSIRDRLVERHMRQGVSFLIPESVLVDVDVRIGRDSIIYPGVVLEGNTSIGGETVVGPGCRIIDSNIGSGVELKGWNYVSRTAVRNRAILEPFVRRGLD